MWPGFVVVAINGGLVWVGSPVYNQPCIKEVLEGYQSLLRKQVTAHVSQGIKACIRNGLGLGRILGTLASSLSSTGFLFHQLETDAKTWTISFVHLRNFQRTPVEIGR